MRLFSAYVMVVVDPTNPTVPSRVRCAHAVAGVVVTTWLLRQCHDTLVLMVHR